MARIEIDNRSGFCFGVVTAINKAEEELGAGGQLYCLGDIVHNTAEVERLRRKGLETIDHNQLAALHDARVLLRAHGEPPETYSVAQRNSITVIDATCPVVLRLQQRIRRAYEATKAAGDGTQIVIYGRRGHAEVNGLVGQTASEALVIESIDEVGAIDFTHPVKLYSQTTKSLEGFKAITDAIRERMAPDVPFESADTICRQVANRVEHLREFALRHDVILFVAGEKSSNGRILFDHCRGVNARAHLVAAPENVEAQWLDGASTIGICGATSTPRWLMERVAAKADSLIHSQHN